MSRLMKIFCFAAVITTTVGGVVVANANYHRPQHVVTLAAAKRALAASPKPANDDVLNADCSWTHWPSLTDF
jgi:hypothetical protein